MTAHLADTPILETDRLRLRAPRMADWPAWFAFTREDRSRFIRGDEAMTEGRAWRAFGHIVGMWALRGYGSFVFTPHDDDTRALGLTGPWHPIDWPEPEIGWAAWLPDAEGRGVVAEAAARARAFAHDVLGWTTAVSYIAPANARSIRLAERLGARLDPGAAPPPGDATTLVYRHPRPEAH